MLTQVPITSFLLLLLLLLSTTTDASISSADSAVRASDNDLTKLINSTLYWGTYRPNLYFGMSNRSPSSRLVTGLMWSASSFAGIPNLRHWCSEGDSLIYGWNEHDGLRYGSQLITDPQNHLKLSTSFAKLLQYPTGGDWVNRISGKSTSANKRDAISLFFYIGLSAGQLHFKPRSRLGVQGDIVLEGDSPEFGSFSIILKKSEASRSPEYGAFEKRIKGLSDLTATHFFGQNVKFQDASNHNFGDAWWQVKERVAQLLAKDAMERIRPSYIRALENTNIPTPNPITPPVLVPTLPNNVQLGSNMFVFQMILVPPFEVDIVFLSHEAHAPINRIRNQKQHLSDTTVNGLVKEMNGEQLTRLLAKHRSEFSDRFKKVFPLISQYSQKHINFAMSAFSNLIGGIGYFNGNWKSAVLETGGWIYQGPSTLYSAVPSRPFFPRGFLWDEGFHHLLIFHWDPKITLEALTYWLNLMDDTGWIPREQILGEEARAKVPEEFQVQSPIYANPPTFFLVLRTIVERIETLRNTKKENPQPRKIQQNQHQQRKPVVSEWDDFDDTYETEVDQIVANEENKEPEWEWEDDQQYVEFLKLAYNKLTKYLDWFFATQSSALPNTFRWHGRTENHTLASGLDDYPRGKGVSETEMHLDLHCWVTVSTQVMHRISSILNYTSQSQQYLLLYNSLMKILNDLHWNSQTGLFSDIFSWEQGELTRHFRYSPHIGYVSLYPLALGLIPHNSERLLPILHYITNATHLWSNHGIRSLSASDKMYGTGENYWRGAIWININYLLLSSLSRNYIHVDGPYQSQLKSLYNNLRNNLVKTLFNSYQKTGFLWEQYDPRTGNGARSHPFTGWSALVVAIMAEKY